MIFDTLYKKVGRRYIPEQRYEVTQSFPEGAWLVVVTRTKNSTSTLTEEVSRVRKDKLGLRAALAAKANVLVDILRKATAGRPPNQPLTPEQRKAWDAVEDSGFTWYTHQSLHDAAREIATELAK